LAPVLTVALGLIAGSPVVAHAAGGTGTTGAPGSTTTTSDPAAAGEPGGAASGPSLTATLFATDIIVVGARNFPPGSDVTVDAVAGDLGGTAVLKATAQGRVLLGFQIPTGLSGTVAFTARSGSATAATSIVVAPSAAPTSAPAPTSTSTGEASPRPSGSSGGLTLAAPGQGTAQPDIPGQWKLAFSDEFAGTTLDQTKWQLCNPSFRALCLPWNGERQVFNAATQDNANVKVSDGQLHLIATNEGGQIRSGMVSTGPWPDSFGPRPAGYQGFSYTYGYYAGRVRIPKGNGYWPSLWQLPSQQQQGGKGWPDTGEYDVFEIPGNNPSEYHFTAHWGGGGGDCGHPCTPQQATISDASAGWHTFGLDWEPNGLTWYVDGKKMGRTVTDQAAIKNYAFYIIANLSVGGTWPPLNGGIDGSTPFPASMDIDWLRVYQHP
jgi:beta-glucanase (GH16 family)